MINFEHKEVVTQHFILFGRLINMAREKRVSASAIEKLFRDRHEHEPKVDFHELVTFYRDISLPVKTLDSYLNIFYSPTGVRRDLLTGSSSSSGSGVVGYQETSLAFIYLAGHALATVHPLPDPIPGISEKFIKRDIQTIRDVFNDLSHGLKLLETWLQNCDRLDQTKEAEEIAEASIDLAKREEHIAKFWEAYKRAIPLLSMCLKNGNYEIVDDVKDQKRYLLPKIALINYKYPISGADGDRYGCDIGHQMEKDLLCTIVESSKSKSESQDNMSKAIDESVKWLEKMPCDNGNGFLIVVSDKLPEIELREDKDFVPSWREEVKAEGFDGFYRGYPIIRLREPKKAEVEDEEKTHCQKVVAVDLRKWFGMRVRKEVVEKGQFGYLNIRTWSPREIRDAIASGKLEKEEVNKAMGNCPVDITFYWDFDKDKLPRAKCFTWVGK
ncbi:MAG: hypothetical protein OEV87_02820 [Phycisphaerae bacterium]|nr:hypothetical protein [Phycisphaerae bacterium]